VKYLGCAYYPEYWGSKRVETDAKLMQEAGINVVRIGEFAWCKMEPEENMFTLEWLHECIVTLGEYGINVIMCTPSATPPAWLTTAYSDTLMVMYDGTRLEHGGRRHYCYTSDTYIRHTNRMVSKLVQEFSKYENIVGWQIDNEPDLCETGGCYCENCQAKFQAWLKNRYGCIEDLNKQWATGFWSMDYTDWRQVRLGALDGQHYTSRALDTRRFFSDALGGYIISQANMIKKYQPDAVVSTNLNGGVFTSLDYNKIFANMDVTMKDLYFDIATMDTNVMILDQFRSYKPGEKFWITETGVGMCGIGRPSHKDQFKAWMWSSFAHGADAYVVFRWRTCLSGQEQELEGMLEHSGHPGHRYQKIKAAFHEMREIAPLMGDLPLQETEIAIVHDYDVMWGYQSNSINKEINYDKNINMLYRELYKRQLSADIIDTVTSLNKYKLVILPSLIMIDEVFAEQLKKFIENGGVLLTQGQIGMKDRNCNYLNERGPSYLQDFLGIKINGGMYLFSGVEADESWNQRKHFSVKLSGSLGEKETMIEGKASTWIGDIDLYGGTALMSFSEDDYEGQGAIVEKQTGKGTSVYVAAIGLDEELVDNLFNYILAKAGVDFRKGVPEHVEVIHRGKYTFMINHLKTAVTFETDFQGKVIHGEFMKNKFRSGEFRKGEVNLEPYGVLILENTK